MNYDSIGGSEEFQDWLNSQNRYGSATQQNIKQRLSQLNLQSFNKLKKFLRQYRDDRVFESYNSIVYALKVLNQFLHDVYPGNDLSIFLDTLEYVKGADDTPSQSPLSNEEVNILLDNTRGMIHHAYWLALFAGLKKGEIINLNVQDVDIEDSAIYIRKNPIINSVLKERVIFLTDTKPLKVWNLRRKYYDVEGSHWLFDKNKNRPKLRINSFNRNFYMKFGFQVNLKRARTTYVYALNNNKEKVNLKIIQEQIGIRSFDNLEKMYGFLAYEMEDSIADQIRNQPSYYEFKKSEEGV